MPNRSRDRRPQKPLIVRAVIWLFQRLESLDTLFSPERFNKGAARSAQHPVVRALLWPIVAPFRLLAAIIAFPFRLMTRGLDAFGDVWQRRRLVHLIQGVPAFAVLVLVGALAFAGLSQDGKLVDSYRAAGAEAFGAKEYERAKVLFERLCQLDRVNPEDRYNLALTLAALNQNERAEAVMLSIAPVDKTGFALAHHWLAKQMLLKPETYLSADLLESAQNQLVRAEAAKPESSEIQLTLAQYYVVLKRPDLAIPHLAKAAVGLPELDFDLAHLLAGQGKREEALAAARRGMDYYRKVVGEKPEDDSARLRLAELTRRMGRFQESVALLNAGLVLKPDGPCKSALAMLYVLNYDELLAKKSEPQVLLAQLQASLRYVPSFQPALVRLAEFAGEPGSAEEKEAQRIIEGLIAEGTLPAIAHFALGVKAWNKDQIDVAKLHLERAYSLDESLAPVANNLAWILTFGEKPDLDRALRIISSVLDRWPNDPNYLDTRGQILVKLERWKEAVSDLEKALPSIPQSYELHNGLSKAYENLGSAGLAARHAEIAAKLKPSPPVESPLQK